MKVGKLIILLLSLSLVGISYAYESVTRLVLLDFSNFQRVDESLYLSKDLSSQDEQIIVSTLAAARKRILAYYGEPTAQPKIIVLSNQEEKRHFGLYDVPGTLVFTPWGNYLLLSYQDAGIDVVAHELVHAEIIERVGYINRQLKIPTWFDEGVAMQVDYRPHYTINRQLSTSEYKRIISLKTPADFWSQDKSQNMENYRGAKAVVSELLQRSDKELYLLLSEIKAGQSSVLDDVTATVKSW